MLLVSFVLYNTALQPATNKVLIAWGIDVVAVVSSPWFIIFRQLFVLLLPLGIWLGIHKEKINPHLPHMRLGNTNIVYIIALSLLLQPAMMAVSGITSIFFPNEIGEMVLSLTDYPYLLLILAIAVTPAICEEVVFRGYIQSTYKNKAFWTMALINGLLFAIMHLNPQQFPYAFIMGIIFAYMVHATRSIRAGVIAHFIMNASQITLMYVISIMVEREDISDEITTTSGYTASASAVPSQIEMIVTFTILGIIALAVTVLAAYVFRLFVLHNRKRVMAYEQKIKAAMDALELHITPDTPETTEIETPEEIPQSTLPKWANITIDVALVLAIVALYVNFIFVIR